MRWFMLALLSLTMILVYAFDAAAKGWGQSDPSREPRDQSIFAPHVPVLMGKHKVFGQSDPSLWADPLRFSSAAGHTLSSSSALDMDASHHNFATSANLLPGPPTERPPLVCFEVNRPPRILSSKKLEAVTIQLLSRSFANSYGKPSILPYTLDLLPASFRDPAQWVGLTLIQNGTARGLQFDRLGSIYMGNTVSGQGVEIWRTDNPEPVNTTGGIVWSAKKEVSKYFDLFRRAGILLFDYPNIVNKQYTTPLNITLSLTVTQQKTDYTPNPENRSAGDASSPADPLPLIDATPVIFPISKQNSSADSKWAVNSDKASAKIRVPTAATAAVIEVYASGTADDEFWYTNVPDIVFEKIVNASRFFMPHGPYRELQVRIDTHLAGITHPSPVTFTGGLNPLLWRPQMSFGAMDQPTYLFDVTPFLGYLRDGRHHEFSIHVVSAEKNQSIPNSWFVSGNLQVALGKNDAGHGIAAIAATGPPSIVEEGRFEDDIRYSGTSKDPEEITATLMTSQPRKVSIQGFLPLPNGRRQRITVQHTINFSNKQYLNTKSQANTLMQTISGSQVSTHGDQTFLSHKYRYPLSVDSAKASRDPDGSDVGVPKVVVHREYRSELDFSGLTLGQNSTVGAASRWPEPSQQSVATKQTSDADGIKYGRQQQTYDYFDSWGYTFHEHVAVFNSTVTSVERSGNLADQAGPVR